MTREDLKRTIEKQLMLLSDRSELVDCGTLESYSSSMQGLVYLLLEKFDY